MAIVSLRNLAIVKVGGQIQASVWENNSATEIDSCGRLCLNRESATFDLATQLASLAFADNSDPELAVFCSFSLFCAALSREIAACTQTIFSLALERCTVWPCSAKMISLCRAAFTRQHVADRPLIP